MKRVNVDDVKMDTIDTLVSDILDDVKNRLDSYLTGGFTWVKPMNTAISIDDSNKVYDDLTTLITDVVSEYCNNHIQHNDVYEIEYNDIDDNDNDIKVVEIKSNLITLK